MLYTTRTRQQRTGEDGTGPKQTSKLVPKRMKHNIRVVVFLVPDDEDGYGVGLSVLAGRYDHPTP
jgi:hypothetical protein